MRGIKSLQDAEIVLRQLEDRINRIYADSVDFNQRRISNAHPSIDQYDYVVRRELRETIAAQNVQQFNNISQTISGLDFDIAVFGLAIQSSLVVGVDLAPHHIAVFDGQFTKWYAKAKVAAVGSSIILDVKLNGLTSILTNPIVIPQSSTAVITGTAFTITTIAETDFLTIDCTQKGSITSGGTIVVKVKYKKT